MAQPNRIPASADPLVPVVPTVGGDALVAPIALQTKSLLDKALDLWTLTAPGVCMISMYADVSPLVEAAAVQWIAAHPGWSSFDYGERPTGMLEKIVAIRAPGVAQHDVCLLLWRRK